jgi:hypothetical protein
VRWRSRRTCGPADCRCLAWVLKTVSESTVWKLSGVLRQRRPRALLPVVHLASGATRGEVPQALVWREARVSTWGRLLLDQHLHDLQGIVRTA